MYKLMITSLGLLLLLQGCCALSSVSGRDKNTRATSTCKISYLTSFNNSEIQDKDFISKHLGENY